MLYGFPVVVEFDFLELFVGSSVGTTPRIQTGWCACMPQLQKLKYRALGHTNLSDTFDTKMDVQGG